MNPPKLLGSYKTPQHKSGDWIMCHIKGLSPFGGYTNAPIPWPRHKKNGRASLILTDDLAEAVKRESVLSIRYYWGVSEGTVWKWRQVLGVPEYNEGTTQWKKDNPVIPEEAAERGRQKAKSPEIRARVSKIKTGVPVPEQTRQGLLRAAKAPKPEGWGKRANEWMLKGKKEKQ